MDGGSFCYNRPMPSNEFDEIDARLLDLIQSAFPLVSRPFDAIAAKLGVEPADVIERISRLKCDSVIRQISAIFDSAALGYTSALVAFRVRPERIDAVAQAVSEHSGVSHCYSRDAEYNLWFTMTLGPGRDIDAEVETLARAEGVESHVVLPALRVFKIGVFFELGASFGAKDEPRSIEPGRVGKQALSEADIAAVRALQKDLPIVDAPFAALAQEAEMTEPELLARAEEYLRSGAMRRFAAVLRHQRAGYRVNAMVCWQVEPEGVAAAGEVFAKHPSVSHCYERATFPDWPYHLYTMIHCRNEDELARVIGELVASSGLSAYRVLRTVKEYKKSRVVYFEQC